MKLPKNQSGVLVIRILITSAGAQHAPKNVHIYKIFLIEYSSKRHLRESSAKFKVFWWGVGKWVYKLFSLKNVLTC